MALGVIAGIHIAAIIWLAIIWFAVSQIITAGLFALQNRSIAAWVVSVNGVSAIYICKPNMFFRALQAVLPAFLAGCSTYLILASATIEPYIPILSQPSRIIGAVGATVLLSLPRIVLALHDIRFPLWGDARILERLARLPNLGAYIRFTSQGRTYILQQFGSSPEELLHIVRRKHSPIATGL